MKKRKKYLIYCWPYNETVGGFIVLHKICDILNSKGEIAYMCPACELPEGRSYIKKIFYGILHPIKTMRLCGRVFLQCTKYRLNDNWNCKVINPFRLIFSNGLKNYIALYPELVSGNPLNAVNVSRILMHNPGHFTKETNYGSGELLFRFSNSFAREFTPQAGSTISQSLLNVGTTPDCFKAPTDKTERNGIAYALRKGKGKKLVHNQENAILIDNLSIKEVAEVFKRVKMFISYDPITAFSRYALLCHCPSVIILGSDEKMTTFRSDIDEAMMYAYSIDDVDKKDWDKSYRKAELMAENRNVKNEVSVTNFIKETQSFFLKS